MRKLKYIAFLTLLLFSTTSCKKEASSIPTNSFAISAVRKSALIGRQEQITIATGDNTYPTSQALLWFPKDYEDSEKADRSYPLIIALDGVGEQGTDINLLLNTGTIASHIADGWNARAINPVDGKSYKFIVFTPQCPVVNGWGWSAKQVKTMLSILKASYRIDTSRIYITGYSAGGWGLWSCITDDDSLCKQFAAIGPVSAASADHPDKLTNVGKYGIACWNICGTSDAFYTNAVKYTNIINSANPPIPAILTGIKNVDHSAWIQAYDTSWRVDNKNFFEWLLQYHK